MLEVGIVRSPVCRNFEVFSTTIGQELATLVVCACRMWMKEVGASPVLGEPDGRDLHTLQVYV